MSFTWSIVKSTGYVPYGDISGFNVARYGKNESAYGTIAANSYTSGDTFVFADLPAVQIIYAKLLSSAGAVLEVFNSTSLTSALAFNLSGGTPKISYWIHYVRGTGYINDGSTTYGEAPGLLSIVTS